MLSYENKPGSKAIALVEGGPKDGEIVYLHDPDYKCCDQCSDHCRNKKKKCCKKCVGGCCTMKGDGYIENLDPYDYVNEDFLRKGNKKMSIIDLAKLTYSLKRNKEPDDEDLNEIFLRASGVIQEKAKTEIHLSGGTFRPLMAKEGEQRDTWFIAGPQGSGKSYFTGKLMEIFKELHPKLKIFVFSRLDEDESLDKHKPIRIVINEEMLEDPIDPVKELKDSLVVFDDIDSIRDKKMSNEIYHLQDDILRSGRKANINCITTSHQINEYQKTRDVMNECTNFVFFPKSGARRAIDYFLDNYIGLNKEQKKKILKANTRWVSIKKTYPMCVLTEHDCYLLK